MVKLRITGIPFLQGFMELLLLIVESFLIIYINNL
jgi:hypothetical protein